MPLKINVRGVFFDSVTLDEAAEWCRSQIEAHRDDPSLPVKVIHTPNAEIVQLCVEQPAYYSLINAADLTIPDGAGVVLASKLLRRPLKKGKVAGIELCERMCAMSGALNCGVYFLGGRPGVAEQAAEKLREKYPDLIVAGTHDGYFPKIDTLEMAEAYKKGEPCEALTQEILESEAEVIRAINESGAGMVAVCLGVPKQEIWIDAHRRELKAALAGGFGGSADVFAGHVKRAPVIFRKLGLEWFYRLLREPSRAGRMMKLPKFIFGTVFSAKK